MDPQRRKVRVAIFSVLSNTTLVTMKLFVGLLIGSVSIISEAIHSGVDLLAAIIALFSVKTSSIPADSRHPFGHGKIENISGTIEALLIFIAAVWIIIEAMKKLMHPEPIETIGWGVGVMLISAAINMIVSTMLFKVGRETDSIALQADAWHLRTDVYTSIGVMVSLGLIWMSQWIFPGTDFFWLDPVAAMGVALLIIKAAYKLTVQSAKDLMDVNLPGDEIERIRRCILEHGSVVRGFHDLRTRKAGHFRFVEFHLKVDPHMSVMNSHGITKILKKKIKEQFPGTTVTIHVEPCDRNCVDKCIEGCLLPDDQRRPIGR
ncbi:MAG TPA: cation diffusion facilitator family transporter [Syntrophales bacterium]|nr:cation diffusion facilitator family transporter [Syntrophales bacterium]